MRSQHAARSPLLRERSRGTSTRRSLALVASVLATGLLALVVPAIVIEAIARDRVLPSVRAGDIDLGGMTTVDARARLVATDEMLGDLPVVLRAGGSSWTATHRALGIGLDVDLALARARPIASSDPVVAFMDRLRVIAIGSEVGLPRRASGDGLERWLDEVARAVDRPAVDGDVSIGSAGVTVRQAVIGTRLPRDAVWRAIMADGAAERTVTVILDPVRPTIDAEDVRAAAEEARAATRPLHFALDGETVPAAGVAIAAVERVDAADGERLVVRPVAAAIDQLVAGAVAGFTRDAANAALLAGGERLVVVPGHDAIEVDAPALRRAIAGWEPGDGPRTIALPVRRSPTAFSTSDAERVATTTTLAGAFTTFFPVSAARAHNIGLAARAFDGQAVAPGEQFSFWGRIGEVTPRTGYVLAGTIIEGVSSEAIGGGLCQVSTTLFNAVALAGYRIDQRLPHSYYIERYPLGRDAAVFAPSVDLRWTNDTAAPAYVRAAATGTSISFWIYAAPSGRTVRFGAPQQWNLRQPAADQPADPQHAPGYVVPGRDVLVTRTVTADGAVVHDDRWYSHYEPVWGGPAAP